MSRPFGIIFGLLSFVAILSITSAYGQTVHDVTISTGAGTSANASCVTANNCYSPNPLTITSGTTVVWTNADKVSHTVTSGKVSDDNVGSIFDSSLVKPGGSFQFTFVGAGTFDYFCSVHPWMIGQVIVENNIMTGTVSSPMILTANTTSSSIGSLTGPNTTSQEPGTPSVESASQPRSSTESTGQYATATPTQALAVQEPPTTASTESGLRAPQVDDSGAQLAAWTAGIVIFAIVSGIGIWTAVRRR